MYTSLRILLYLFSLLLLLLFFLSSLLFHLILLFCLCSSIHPLPSLPSVILIFRALAVVGKSFGFVENERPLAGSKNSTRRICDRASGDAQFTRRKLQGDKKLWAGREKRGRISSTFLFSFVLHRPLPSSSSPSSMPSGYSIIDRSAAISSVCRDRSKCLEHCHCIGGTILLLLLLRFAINAMDISLHRSLATILSPQLNRREKSEARQKASGFYIPSL